MVKQLNSNNCRHVLVLIIWGLMQSDKRVVPTSVGQKQDSESNMISPSHIQVNQHSGKHNILLLILGIQRAQKVYKSQNQRPAVSVFCSGHPQLGYVGLGAKLAQFEAQILVLEHLPVKAILCADLSSVSILHSSRSAASALGP